MQRFLVVQTGFIGDVVLSTPVWNRLRALYPDSEITLLTTPICRELFADDPVLNEVLAFDKRGSDSGVVGLLRMASRIRAKRFDVVFSLHKSSRTSLLLSLSQIPIRFGFSEASLGFLYTKTVPRSDLPHDALRNLAVLRAIGEEPESSNCEMSLRFSENTKREAEKLLAKASSGKPVLGIAPGSVWPTKRWTSQGFAEVANHFSAQGFHCVLLGGPGDVEAGREVESYCSAEVSNLVGDTSLLLSAAIVAQCAALVTNDSAPQHFASALKVPVVTVFCATVPEFGYGPWAVTHQTIGVEALSCRPCGRHGGRLCPTGTHACQLGLMSGEVIAATESVLSLDGLRRGDATV